MILRAVRRGAFEGVIDDNVSPFGYMKGEGIDAGYGEHDWICNRDKERTDNIFNKLGPVGGKISGQAAKQELIKSKLPNSVLSKIWKLSDVDGDGFLDSDEFALAMHLIGVKLEGCELPNVLPDHLVPPLKRC
uniref:EF-hand domain-containing protein n=1 Tax=Glossina palpalis gambiensis TaxID=67801 RepID=A0A1B0BTV5_9MUSC